MHRSITGLNAHDDGRSSSPIFIVGTERSGSNALRIALDSHPQIASPHPPHLLRYLAPLEASYGDLADERALKRLIDDALWIIRWHINPWDDTPTRDVVRGLLHRRDLYAVNDAIHRWYVAREGKRRWVCKSTFSVHYIDRLCEFHPGARFIWLVRDPRDVVASSKTSVFNPSSALLVARLWARHQRLVLDAMSRGKASILMLKYEDLATNPGASLQRVCDFVGESYSPAMLEAFSGREARKSSELSRSWVNLGRPISAFSVGSYKSRLTLRETACVESIAGDVMAACGYETTADADRRRPCRRDYATALLESVVARTGIELRSILSDRNFGLRWRRDLLVCYLGMVRR